MPVEVSMPSLDENTVAWLLEEDNPPVRHFTLVHVLGRPSDDSEVVKAKAAIMTTGIVPKFLAKQDAGGFWGVPGDFYIRSKYKGTVWSVIALAQLGADGSDERIRQSCEFLLAWSQDRESGGFSYRGTAEDGGSHRGVLPCLTGNLAWSLITFGYFEDPRLQKAIDWITRFQRFDDGVAESEAATGWPYDIHTDCWGRHSCTMGVIKDLKALSAIPAGSRDEAIRNTIAAATEYLLEHHVFKQSHSLGEIAKQGWLKLGFPLMWNTDILEMVEVLTGLGCRDERMHEAIDAIITKQDSAGLWKNENPFAARLLVQVEPKGRQSKWITARALSVLKMLAD